MKGKGREIRENRRELRVTFSQLYSIYSLFFLSLPLNLIFVGRNISSSLMSLRVLFFVAFYFNNTYINTFSCCMQIIPKKRYETSVRNAEFEIVSREQKKL